MKSDMRQVTVELKDIGKVNVVDAGPLTRKLLKMVYHNGVPFAEQWMDRHGLHGIAKGYVYNEKQHRLVEVVGHPLWEFLLGMRDNKLYHILDYKMVGDIKTAMF